MLSTRDGNGRLERGRKVIQVDETKGMDDLTVSGYDLIMSRIVQVTATRLVLFSGVLRMSDSSRQEAKSI